MSDCTDPRFRQMLYAYELGLLTEAETREMELHLYECEHCFAQVQKFREAAELLRDDKGIKEEIGRMAAESDISDSESAVADKKQGRAHMFRRRLLPVSLAVVAVLVILLLKPFSIEIHPTHEAVASENRLMVAKFENAANPSDSANLGEIIANLLIADFSESRYIDVVSSQRVRDISRVIETEGRSPESRGLTAEIARRSRARWILTGTIVQEAPTLVVSSELIEAESGDVLVSERVEGATGDGIFALVDSLSARVKKSLWLPAGARQEPDPVIADVTTHSAEAYRNYLEGVKYFERFYIPDAVTSFRRALEHDSTFAMAYYYLARTAEPNAIERALLYSDRASERERRFIEAQAAYQNGNVDQAVMEIDSVIADHPDDKEALYLNGAYLFTRLRTEQALPYFKRVIALDPFHQQTWNMLAYTYSRLDSFDLAIDAINKYVELAPDDPNPYDSRGDLYTSMHRLQDAIASYELAMQKKPDFYTSLIKLGCLYVFAGRYADADTAFKRLAITDARSWRITGRLYQSYIPIYRGKYQEALQVLDDNIAACRLELGDEYYASFRHMKATIYEALGDWQNAIIEAEKSVQLYRLHSSQITHADRPTYIKILSEAGDAALADQVAAELKNDLEAAGEQMNRYWYAAGAIEFSKGNLDSAIVFLEKAVYDTTGIFWVTSHQLLARAYLEKGRYSEAAEEYEYLLSMYSERLLYTATCTVPSYFYLARAYEGMGRTADAVTYYRKFLDIWHSGDANLPLIEQAKEKLSKLQS